MAGRILTLQRQARELGRLRAGTFEKPTSGRGRPSRSKTWILTTHQRAYLDTAAELWGGQVEPWTPQGSKDSAWRLITEASAIDAILPPGDPLSQSYEMWSRGGCQRRCDGETEQLSGKPCLCRKEFGDEFHLQPPDQACRPHTRLSVILPDLPDLGVWRLESKGFYAANEIPAAVDLIHHATGGKLAVPVRLRIEPRKRVAAGQTKNFPVLVVEIRGATAGQILAGQPATVALAGGGQQAAVDGGPQRQAIGAAPAASEPQGEHLTPDKVVKLAALVKNVPQLQALWKDAARDGALTDDVKTVLEKRADELKPQPAQQVKPTSAPPATDGSEQPPAETAAGVEVAEGEVEPDTDVLWPQILTAAGKQKWNSDALEERIYTRFKKPSDEINGRDMQMFLDEVKGGQIK